MNVLRSEASGMMLASKASKASKASNACLATNFSILENIVLQCSKVLFPYCFSVACGGFL